MAKEPQSVEKQAEGARKPGTTSRFSPGQEGRQEPARAEPKASVGAQSPAGGEDTAAALGAPVRSGPEITSVREVEPENPEATAVAVEFAPSAGDLDAAIPDLHIEDLPDGTKVTRTAHGDTTVETPTPAPYRENTSR